MSRLLGMICSGILIAGLCACGKPASETCTAGTGSPGVVFTLYFGGSIPDRGTLTTREWQSFLDSTVTANLPNGYTVVNAAGAWMNPFTRKTITEATKVLLVALPKRPDSLAAVNRIRSAYQTEFHQQQVGMTVEHACLSF